MAEQLKLFRLAGLEDWRIKAFNFGGPLGHVFSRTFELMHTVIRDGTANETSVGYAVESLSRERELALSRDDKGDDAVNSLIYGVADNLKVMMDSILEERRPAVEERPQASERSSSEAALPQFHVPKEEPLFMPLAPKTDPGQDAPCSSRKVQPQASAQPPAHKKESAHHTTTALPQKRPAIGQSTAAPPAKRSFDAPTPAVPKTAPPPTTRPMASAATPATTSPAAPGSIHAVRAAAAAVAATKPASAQPAVVFHMCDTCGKSFESDKGLQRHAFIHNALKCVVCHKFVNPSKMKAHLAQYHGRRKSTKKGWDQDSDDDEGVYERRPRTPSPSIDDASAFSGATTAAYNTPVATATISMTSKERIDCPITNCEAYRNNLSMMKDHLRVTHGVKPYACETCEDSFFMKTDLVKHKLVCGEKEIVRESSMSP